MRRQPRRASRLRVAEQILVPKLARQSTPAAASAAFLVASLEHAAARQRRQLGQQGRDRRRDGDRSRPAPRRVARAPGRRPARAAPPSPRRRTRGRQLAARAARRARRPPARPYRRWANCPTAPRGPAPAAPTREASRSRPRFRRRPRWPGSSGGRVPGAGPASRRAPARAVSSPLAAMLKLRSRTIATVSGNSPRQTRSRAARHHPRAR